MAAPSLWTALPQLMTLSSMTTAAFKVKLKTYLFLQEHYVQRCEQRMLEQRYINVTIMIMIIIVMLRT